MKKIKGFFLWCFYVIKYFFIEIFNPKSVVVNGFFPLEKGLGNYNYGDDLNLYLLAIISNKKIIPSKFSVISRLLKKTKYSCIGSILGWADENTIIWGSGAIEKHLSNKFSPKKILAVRGPLTRNYLIEKGFDCPEIYGDPALLVSMYYTPLRKIRYKIGIIPHYVDKDNEVLSLYETDSSVKIINIQSYGKWTDFIDLIASCEFILSSSLHGIIVSDSYHIPNMRCKFSDKIVGGNFKYNDYYMSVGKKESVPFYFNRFFDVEYLLSLSTFWEPPQISYSALLDVCPFLKKHKNEDINNSSKL